MIIATAGHIDHGKTTLVHALTGVDTDSLPEEKERGISINLGFAYWHPPGGGTVGFVDVPGHERFVRNMLAGVCGIDYVMLVVAADDGVMPQTVEHLNILDLLAVARGIAIITKADRVSSERVEEVAAGVRALLATTSSLAAIDIVTVSAHTGAGIARLRATLAEAAQVDRSRKVLGRNFRYAIDRAFSIAGSGTVVTGTVFDGTVTVGDHLTISPGGIKVRIRSIQKNGKTARHASAGERCGLNLAGVAVDDVGRGDWLVAPIIHAPTQRIDVRLKLLSTEASNLKHWTPLHLHLGTAEVAARAAIRRGESIAPGGDALVQLTLATPVAALNGDRFIIRDQSARRTLGGGTVIDPFVPKRRINREARAAQLAMLEGAEPSDALRAMLAANTAGVDIEQFQRVFNLTPDRLDGLLRETDLVVLGKAPSLVFSRMAIDAIGTDVVAALQGFHRDNPQFLGVEVGALGKRCALAFSNSVLTEMLRLFANEKRIELNGTLVSLPLHRAAVNSTDEAMWQKVKLVFDAAGFKMPSIDDVAAAAKVKKAVLEDMLYHKMRSGEVFLVAPGRFYPRTTLAQLAALARDVAEGEPEHKFTAALFRDRSGVNRITAIEILECLDRLGITLRSGNIRVMRKDFAAVLAVPPDAPGGTASPN
jgi:selenocysteine-specific elongation factor